MQINEGGNIFKDGTGNPETQRINQTDVKPTVAWLETVTGLPLLDNMLGSTGLKATSGDLDLAVDANKVSKDELFNQLSQYVTSQGQDPKSWVRKSGISVHFKTPIAGRSGTGFVQTDFMFVKKPDFSKFILRQDQDSTYKGATRNILINSMAKSMGYKLNQNTGIEDRATGELITDNIDQLAKLLLDPSASAADLGSVEKIVAKLKNDPKKEQKLADFRDHMARTGTPFQDDTVAESDASIMARLRDRIVNQGMQVIVEGVRIEHPEDMVFTAGSRGLKSALDGIKSSAAQPHTATVKWDGKPAIIFGRKPSGEFVLTDKSGFLAKGYDGLATSPEQIAQIMQQRGGERGELIAIYQRLFPMLRAAVSSEFRGYVQGDLMYATTPTEQNGQWVFQPNTVAYRVPVDSELGKKIAQSSAAVAVHTYLSEPGVSPQLITADKFNPVSGLLLLDPTIKESKSIKLPARTVKDVEKIISQYSTGIDRLFDPQELRARKISDFPQLIQTYINSRVRSGSYTNLMGGFGEWVKGKSPTKAPRIFEWATENKESLAAVFQAFLELSSLKNILVQQLDSQGHEVQASINDEPGHEGYVGNGMKFVDRMRFSSANFAKNNPELS
jgi:nucleotide-binding universal stress UspA family protein